MCIQPVSLICRPISDLEKTLAALVPAAAAAASATAQEPATTEADDAGACQAAGAAAAAEPVTEVAAADTIAAADPLESDSIQELLAHMSALETLAVPAAAPSSTSACSSPSGRRTPGSTCRMPAPRSAAVAEDAQQRKAIWEQDGTAEEVAVGSAPCFPAAASAGGARCINHGLELRISSASKDGSSASGAELPARLSYAAAAAPHSPHVSSAGCASPKAVCRITQFAAVSASVSQSGQASDSQACSRTDSGIV
jgi:hypothetical protein